MSAQITAIALAATAWPMVLIMAAAAVLALCGYTVADKYPIPERAR